MNTTILGVVFVNALALAATAASAQTQQQYDRIDTATRYAIASSI